MPDESLDPADWAQFRQLGHRMLDDALDWLEHVRERPVWQPLPESARAALRRPLPRAPEGAEAAYDDFRRHVLPYPMGNVHPRFWAWVMGTGTPFGVLADMLASTMNPNMGGGEHAPNHVEIQVLDWCRQMLGFPAESSGLLVSGGSMANLVGLAVARHVYAGVDVRRVGVRGASGPLTVYGSRELHSSVQKAVEMLGLGSDALRFAPVDAEYRVDVAALAALIRQDRAAGAVPICVVANLGTVNTGAIDDLDALADLCAKERIWLHVDGAFGALAALVPEYAERTRGMTRADSVAFDLHKWMYMPFEAGCVLVRDAEAHRRTFSVFPDYLKRSTRGVAGGDIWLSEYGIQLTRGFRALKVWMSLKEHGIERYARLVRQNIEQARYLAGLVTAAPDLELMAPVPLNIVCFRWTKPGVDDETLDAINQEVLLRLHESGVAVPSNALLGGRYALRVAITNHRSRREDFELLVREVRRLGSDVEAGQRAGAGHKSGEW
ncbi:MAG TPA: pyridoxal-dependent decarboxylase [Gemmatimonadales bacterium]|nr:pyridoxal-dependent decarboxylase [Gemmatimonadales bacterium]